MPKRAILLFLSIFLAGALVITVSSFAQQSPEQITITTYYPSPYGVYKNLMLYPYAVSDGDNCLATQRGLMAYADNTHGNQPLYCNGTKWQDFAGIKVYQHAVVCGANTCTDNTSISSTTYPNAYVVFVGSTQYDSDRKITLSLASSGGSWVVTMGNKVWGDSHNDTTVSYAVFYWK